MSLYKSINIDALDKRFQVTFMRNYNNYKARIVKTEENVTVSKSSSEIFYLTKTILKDLIIFPFAISFLTTIAKILFGRYSGVLYRHGFVMGAHFKKIMVGYYKNYFLPIPAK
ncbi:hypothetical protein QEN19_000137 [Hanseniaspora menglaensis]